MVFLSSLAVVFDLFKFAVGFRIAAVQLVQGFSATSAGCWTEGLLFSIRVGGRGAGLLITEQNCCPDILCLSGLGACLLPVLPVCFDTAWADTERSISCDSLGFTSAASLLWSEAERVLSCLALKSCFAPGGKRQHCALVSRY